MKHLLPCAAAFLLSLLASCLLTARWLTLPDTRPIAEGDRP